MATLKKHHIKVKSDDLVKRFAKIGELKDVDGIEDVRGDAGKGSVFVKYDLNKCRVETIEHKLMELGFSLADDPFHKFKRGWIRFTEQNELDAMHAKPHSCCEAPHVEHKSGKKKDN